LTKKLLFQFETKKTGFKKPRILLTLSQYKFKFAKNLSPSKNMENCFREVCCSFTSNLHFKHHKQIFPKNYYSNLAGIIKKLNFLRRNKTSPSTKHCLCVEY